MPLPGDVLTVTVTGTLLDASGRPVRGAITFAPSGVLRDATGSVMILSPRTYRIGAAGTFTTDPLAATDSPDITPAGWTYVITLAIQDTDEVEYAGVAIPHSPSPVDLSALI